MATKTSESSPIVKMAVAGIAAMALYYVSQGLSSVASYLNDLPVEGTNISIHGGAKPPASAPQAVSAIHPLLVESGRKAANQATETNDAPIGPMVSLDKLFHEDTPTVVGAPVVVFDFAQLKQQVQLGAVTNEGAVINGKFYASGEKLPFLAFQPTSEATIELPVLRQVGVDYVVIARSSRRKAESFKVQLH